MLGQQAQFGRLVDRAHQIEMLRRGGEGGELQSALGQEDAARRVAERGDRSLHVGDFRPLVAFARRPGGAGKHQQRNFGSLAGRAGMGRHLRGEGMGGVDNSVDFFLAQERRQVRRRRRNRQCGSEWGRAGDFACARPATGWGSRRRVRPERAPVGWPASCRRESGCARRWLLGRILRDARPGSLWSVSAKTGARACLLPQSKL